MGRTAVGTRWWEHVAGWFGVRWKSPWITMTGGRRYTVAGRKVVVTRKRRPKTAASRLADGGWRSVIVSNRYLLLLGVLGVALLLYGRRPAPSVQVTSHTTPPYQEVTGVGTTPPGTGLQPELPLPAEGTPQVGGNQLSLIEDSLARMLERVLTQVPGAGKVSAVVLLDSSTRLVLAENTRTSTERIDEKDANGGTRTSTRETRDSQYLMARTASGASEAPVVTQYLAPQIRGVLVVADGAADPRVAALLYQAVQTVLSVPMYKIAILPRDGGH